MANKVISVYDSTKAIARPALSGDVADDAEIALPTLANGGFILVATSPEGGLAHLSAAGAVTILCGSTNFVGTDTDAKLCVYDAGTVANIKQRLGSAKRVTAILFGS